MDTRYRGSDDPLSPDNRPATVDDDYLVAGRILHRAIIATRGPIALIGERLAEVTAEHGLEYARGWLAGLWYVGGNRPVGAGNPATYHDVVATLQGYIGIEIVTTRTDVEYLMPVRITEPT